MYGCSVRDMRFWSYRTDLSVSGAASVNARSAEAALMLMREGKVLLMYFSSFHIFLYSSCVVNAIILLCKYCPTSTVYLI